MRTKKSLINSVVAVVAYILSFLPIFIVRKVFLDHLGIQLVGLSSLYNNIIGYLTIIEMGVSTAIIFSLYKPFNEGNHEKVAAYVNFYKKFYRLAASVIFIVGICLIPFLHIFIKGDISRGYMQIGFVLFLINTVIAYLFGYKQCLLNVAQEAYKISITMTSAKILIAILQVFVILKYESFYAYIIVQILVNLVFYIVINRYIDKRYPYIKNKASKLDAEERKGLGTAIKGIFFHKIGELLVFSTDNIVISSFIGLSYVTLYNNYILIINAFSGIVSQAIAGITASIGHLLLLDDNERVYTTHKRVFFLNFIVASTIAIVLTNTISSFITLWIGEQYKLDGLTVTFLILNLYFQMMRGQVEQFKNASGEFYKDRYAPLIEGVINLVFSLVLVRYIGLVGVLIGTFISNMTVIFITQPYIVYKYVMKKPLSKYFKRYFAYTCLGLIPLVLTYILTSKLKVNVTIGKFLLNCVINILVIGIFYLITLRKTEEYKFYKGLIIGVIRRYRH